MKTTEPIPTITLTNRDYERLLGLARGRHGRFDEVTDVLAHELDRAGIVEPNRIPANVVTMNSRVSVRKDETGEILEVTLVYPAEEDVIAGNLSILTPVGVALIGLAEGESLAWTTRNGQTKTLTVGEVLFQPEANGRFDL